MMARGELLRASLIRHLLTSALINQGPVPADPPQLWLQPLLLLFYFIYSIFIAVVIIFGIFMLSIAGIAEKTPPIPTVPLEEHRQSNTRTPQPVRALHSRDPVAQVHRRDQNWPDSSRCFSFYFCFECIDIAANTGGKPPWWTGKHSDSTKQTEGHLPNGVSNFPNGASASTFFVCCPHIS
ncbi:hypothetical protein M407DRAFT_207863 [Tulasnella calospora MUT 4182]|uniref:Uncharacterized protein n=1 Tax=Tulasnella calospora MUT 4182 TaxID=1051891 RepID=A0A0C3LWA2_9AGAM|nr:hypothetical protein M407DRAFT_207863 [Tulasnella calospora MUT 4182]